MTDLIPNPFRYGNPVPTEHFVGRQSELRILFSRIYNGESTAIVGGHKIGKSSLLHYIGEEKVRIAWPSLNGTMAFLRIDCQFLQSSERPIDLWRTITTKIEQCFPDLPLREQIERIYHHNFRFANNAGII